MLSENYTLIRRQPTPGGAYVITIAIRLENMSENTKSHAELKSNILKYITFQSAKRLSPGVYHTCDDIKCQETMEITHDDIKIALATGFDSEKAKFYKRYEELQVQVVKHIGEFKIIQDSYDTCLKEIDEEIKQVPTKEAKKIDLTDEICILEDIITKKKYELVKLE